MTREAYDVIVERDGDDDPIVSVYFDDRVIARRTIRTFGECASLGPLLTDPSTPERPAVE